MKRLSGVTEPVRIADPSIQGFLRNEFPDALQIRHSMVADFTGENCRIVLVEGALPVVPRTPEMLLRRIIPAVPAPDGIGKIRRTRKIVARRIKSPDRIRKNLAGNPVEGRRKTFCRFFIEKELIAFVVAAPEGKRRMIPQAQDNSFRLLPDRFTEPGIVRRAFAGKHEILPDQQSEPVAEREEFLVLIHVSAPAADQVASQIPEQLQSLPHPFRILPVKRIGWNPVCPLDEHRPVVDNKLKFSLSALHLLRPFQTDGADSRLPDAHIGRSPAMDQLQFHRIQIRFSNAERVPEPR